MNSLTSLFLSLLLWPWPGLLDPSPYDPPSKPVAILRSEATFEALGWRSRWEWQGAASSLDKLGVDYEVLDPVGLDDWNGRVLVLPNVRNMSPTTVETIKAKNIQVLATYMASYRKHDNSSWSPNNFALAPLFAADFQSWVGSGAQADHLQLSAALGGAEVPLGRHLAMLVKPHPNATVLASWGDDKASIVQGPRGIYVGEDLFAPENSDSLQVQQLIAALLNRLSPGLAASPVEAGRSSVPSPPVTYLPGMNQTIRVGLEPLQGQVSFRAREGLTIRGKKGGTTLAWDGKPTWLSGKPFVELLRKRPNGTYQWVAYRGTLEIRDKGELINVLDFEHYLAGVVPSEVPAYFPAESLKAMAVVARTYGLSHLKRHKSFDVCAEVHCQVYRGLANEAESTNAAVKATTGQKLEYNGKPIDATFHAACGGVGVDVWRTWPGSAKLPYLKGQSDGPNSVLGDLSQEAVLRQFLDKPPASFCSDSGRFRWKERFTRAELREKLAKGLEGSLGEKFHGLSELSSIKVTSRTPQGRVETLEIRSPQEVYTVTGDAIRWLWSGGKIGTGGLQSTLFYLLEEKDAITAVGGGWGHGVGLCQQGASGRANAGQNYTQIISHYYPGTALKSPPAPAPAKTPTPATPAKPGAATPGKPGVNTPAKPAPKPATPKSPQVQPTPVKAAPVKAPSTKAPSTKVSPTTPSSAKP